MNPIYVRGLIYGTIAFLTPFSDTLLPILREDRWPTLYTLAGCALTGVVATLLTLRAYIDGTVERAKPEPIAETSKP